MRRRRVAQAILVACLVHCSPAPPARPEHAARAAVHQLADTVGRSEEDLRLSLLRLDMESRRCARQRHATQDSACHANLERLRAAIPLSDEALGQLRSASILLRRELRFLEGRRGLAEADVRRVFGRLLVRTDGAAEVSSRRP